MRIDDAPLQADPELTRRVSRLAGRSLIPLPLRWQDSANWLWRSEEASPQLFKLARRSPASDGFWWGIQQLFGLDRWRTPEALTRIPSTLPARLPLSPLPMVFVGRLGNAPLWSLPWCSATPPPMNEALAARLGTQLARLHRQALPGFGHPAGDVFPLSSWPRRARNFMETHPNRGWLADLPSWPLPSKVVWSLPDLRSDQFLAGTQEWRWSDWEALVWAPLEWDLCLLELVLESGAQRDAFLATYRRYHAIPDLSGYRPGMRSLALLLALHGERATARTLHHPHWLKD
ncbi:hypothetical protein [Salinicola acroporae]|uniref:Aminoglycoside phosphotransferase domain-containing protein n=1 Tax=Salinicola acroporae TaxID=1541440 RepID=A0ABT6I7A2_9GAMM|nr:hypothetical protein [Salinicola acroporae]MDH4573135.1 hypothetical protein [Salinicola acroporae]